VPALRAIAEQLQIFRVFAASVLACVVVLGASGRAGAGEVKDNLYAVKALSPTDSWAVGNFGSIYQTRDGGRSWAKRESGTKMPLFGVDFADAEHGWAVGRSSLILHTADGGKTWNPQKSPLPPDKHLFNVKVVDARTVWVVGDWGAIGVTHDGGATWQDHSLGTFTVRVEEVPGRVMNTLTDDIILYDVSFPDPEHGFIAGEFGTLLATTDGGKTWAKKELNTEKTLFGVSFASALRGWAVGIDGLVLRTQDGGNTWNVQRGQEQVENLEDLGFIETFKNPGLYDVEVIGQYGAIIGDTGMVLTTADGGETWVQHALPEDNRMVWLRGLSLVPGTHGFFVGASGFAAMIDHDKVVLPNGKPTR
jgi:photosystem II stability/assembly factor-like uncharacterized protein